MRCRCCSSIRVQRFHCELSVSLPGIQRLKVPPVYVCREALVCLNCGFAELTILPPELQKLAEGLTNGDEPPPVESRDAKGNRKDRDAEVMRRRP